MILCGCEELSQSYNYLSRERSRYKTTKYVQDVIKQYDTVLMLTHIHNTESEVKFISNKLQGIQM